MSNSPLVDYVKLSPMHSGARRHKIDTVTVHHMAGNLSVETCGEVFQSRQASTNYGVDSRGRVGLYVDEKDRAWSSASSDNDNRAVNIEVANCAGAPDWPVTGAAYNKLVLLVADICRRNGIARLVWSENKADRVEHRNGCNMTVHRDFMATLCPGPYLMEKMPQLARDVNRALDAGTEPEGPEPETGGQETTPYTVRVEVEDLLIRSGPGTDYAQKGYIPQGVYTVVEEKNGFGRLKSGAGWIALKWVKKEGVR